MNILPKAKEIFPWIVPSTREGAYVSKPSVCFRFCRKLGFKFHLGEEPEGHDLCLGWSKTITKFHFSWWDRILILLSGRLDSYVILYTDKPFDKAMTRQDWQIPPPCKGYET